MQNAKWQIYVLLIILAVCALPVLAAVAQTTVSGDEAVCPLPVLTAVAPIPANGDDAVCALPELASAAPIPVNADEVVGALPEIVAFAPTAVNGDDVVCVLPVVAAVTPTPAKSDDGEPAQIRGLDDKDNNDAPAATAPIEKTANAPHESSTDQVDDQVEQAGCTHCGDGLLAPRHYEGSYSHGSGCSGCGGDCIPGRKPCNPGLADDTYCGRIWNGLCECLCCPDPCYEPEWIATANAAFFVDAARPATYMRFRWDAGLNLLDPDRAEFFWARQGTPGKGPAPKKHLKGELGVDYYDFSLYNEAATGALGAFVEMPYRSLYPEVANHAAGFGDVSMGTKSLLLDCQLLQLTFQFKVVVPAGSVNTGIGTGHTTLEPSLLLALHLCKDTYLQAQFADAIPIGGDPQFAGPVLHIHWSLNHLLCRPLSDMELMGTLETNVWKFQGGAFSDPLAGFSKATRSAYLSGGPGIRLLICDKYEIGFAAAFAATDEHWANQLYRTEFMLKF
jgi:hypothetical protein